MRRAILGVAVWVALAPPAAAAETGAFELDPGGRVRAARAADVDGDGRKDLLLLVESRRGDATHTDLVVARTPKTPAPATYFAPAGVTRLPCSGDGAGARAKAGAVAIGRFGPAGEARLRFLAREGVADQAADGSAVADPGGRAGRSLLARDVDSAIVFWDGVGDLDGDGKDECWFPNADGRMVVWGGAPGNDATLALDVANEASSSPVDLVQRTVRVPTLVAGDVDGDGTKELIGLVGTDLTVWRRDGAAMNVAGSVTLPFLEPDPKRPPEVIRSPRLTLADVDADGKVDLLVTLVSGRADRVGGLRTSLFHYAGPLLRGQAAEMLPPPKSRLDTESVALHPRFTDVDGDGRLDYVADSIRGTLVDLIQNAMGKDPDITYTVFRFDAGKGGYETTPLATFARPYASAEARGNRFGRSGYLDGDFDGDGRADLLDLGTLEGFSVSKGAAGGGVAAGGRASFDAPLLARVAVPKPLTAEALVVDLDGDRRSEAVVWSEDRVYVIATRATR
jgi:hypothetical protein